MNFRNWSPASLGVPDRQNSSLWHDMELAYSFIEKYAPFSISGNLEGFLFELVNKRWSLACENVFQTPPTTSQIYSKFTRRDLLISSPAGLSLTKVDKLVLNTKSIEKFKEFSANQKDQQPEVNAGILYGYGTDGLGTYIPLHLLWPELRSYWGIYISEIGVMNLAANFYNSIIIGQMHLFSEYESKLVGSLIQIAYQVILRHQLFHFKVEQWALLFELATGNAYYMPYLQEVYLPTIYDQQDNNLEEALANLSILLSTKIKKIEKDANFQESPILASGFLDHQGPNYRNYNLLNGVPSTIERYDREIRYRAVVNYLCNQIIRHELRPQEPLTPYFIAPPNNNFLRAENLCPIYLVRNLPYQVGVIA